MKWVKCSDKMPEHMIAVFTWGIDRHGQQGGEVNWYLEPPDAQWCHSIRGIHVTHWMPWPEPPIAESVPVANVPITCRKGRYQMKNKSSSCGPVDRVVGQSKFNEEKS